MMEINRYRWLQMDIDTGTPTPVILVETLELPGWETMELLSNFESYFNFFWQIEGNIFMFQNFKLLGKSKRLS